MAIRQLSDGNDDGTLLGQGTSDPIGFYGLTTPIAQPVVTVTTTQTTMDDRILAALVALNLIRTT